MKKSILPMEVRQQPESTNRYNQVGDGLDLQLDCEQGLCQQILFNRKNRRECIIFLKPASYQEV